MEKANSGVALHIASFNIEHPFERIREEYCKKHSCPSLEKWHNANQCKHESKADDYSMQEKDWNKRKDKIIKMISHIDIVCLQEVDLAIIGSITDSLKDMAYIFPEGCYKNFAAVLYEKNKFDLISSNIDIGNHSVIASLKHKETQKVIRVCSVHLKGYDFTISKESKEGDQQLVNILQTIQIGSHETSALLVAGDFNAYPQSERINIMRSNQFAKSLFHKKSIPFTNYNPRTKMDQTIDYIFAQWKEDVKFKTLGRAMKPYLPSKESIDTENSSKTISFEERLSDHYPVYVKMILTKTNS